ncbi:Acyl-thioesterase [Pleurostoma richardsiae]|uniref:Acyl-thioesterase n=1 Tax=Pleurostoma richardsiae TaxID=41990 RepID=A0AA38VTT1_9PEZI|nr:Acyl-thioesterase [Pleurostoma richardsiae]
MDDELAKSRLAFHENMELVSVPAASETRAPTAVSRFMSTRAAWLPGSDLKRLLLPAVEDQPETVDERPAIANRPMAAYGGHVYAQSALAACKVVEEDEKQRGVSNADGRLGLHTIHGTWNTPGQSDRPFIYEVAPVSTGRSFCTYLVNARQPTSPSASGDHYTLADASSSPLDSTPCFTALISLKLPEPHSGGANTQDVPPQRRFAEVLSSRPPDAWPPAPPLDLESVRQVLGGAHPVGTFPTVDMRKVDLSAWNAGRGVADRRELILYRLLRPLPLPAEAPEGENAANRHVLVHAFESDRNSLLMIANHLGFGLALGRAASLAYSIVVHVNAEEAVMAGEGWWIQEVAYPRAAAGRTTLLNKIWSPEGVHVATGMQDGVCRVQEGKGRL